MAKSIVSPEEAAAKRLARNIRLARLKAAMTPEQRAEYRARSRQITKRHLAKLALDPIGFEKRRERYAANRQNVVSAQSLEYRRKKTATRNQRYYEKLALEPQRLAEYRRKAREKAMARRSSRSIAQRKEADERAKLSRIKHAATIKAAKAARRKAHPEEKRQAEACRRAAKRAAGGRFTISDIDEIANAQRFRCAVCRVDIRKRYHIDHIKPLARQGTNNRRNLQLLCQPCNSHKHARDPIEFMQSRGFLL